MSETEHSLGVIIVVLERFEKYRLPRALRLKDKVDTGRPLNEADLHFLQTVYRDTLQFLPLVDHQPKYQSIVAKAIHLYHHITETGLQNEKKTDFPAFFAESLALPILLQSFDWRLSSITIFSPSNDR